MENTRSYYRQLLRAELSNRQKINARFSLRAFARFLQVDPGFLSRILNGQRKLSYEMACTIVQMLQLQENEKTAFLNSLLKEKRVVQTTAEESPVKVL
jgi:plasmid maintenance system antidote protein VapI